VLIEKTAHRLDRQQNFHTADPSNRNEPLALQPTWPPGDEPRVTVIKDCLEYSEFMGSLFRGLHWALPFLKKNTDNQGVIGYKSY
jgi:hypothetical protein